MTFDKIEKKIASLQKKREDLFIASLPEVARHERDEQRFYFFLLIGSLVGIVFSIYIFYGVHDQTLLLWGVGLFVLVGLVSVLHYLTLLERHNGIFHKTYGHFTQKYTDEIHILERFRNGDIDAHGIRLFYLNEMKNNTTFSLHHSRLTVGWVLASVFMIAVTIVIVSL